MKSCSLSYQEWSSRVSQEVVSWLYSKWSNVTVADSITTKRRGFPPLFLFLENSVYIIIVDIFIWYEMYFMLPDVVTYYREILSVIGIIIGIISYIPYLRDMFLWKTHPHAFTRFLWWLMTGIAFVAQVIDWWWAGTRVMWFTAVACIVIFLFAMIYGKRDFAKADYVFLIISLASLGVRYVTDTPLWSAIIVTLADMFAFFPTYRKSRIHPSSETISTYTLSSIKMLFAVIALENFTIITALYPASLVVMNWLFVVMVMYRLRVMKK